jgi:uncharacterized protein YndB with AHSA1/START domain
MADIRHYLVINAPAEKVYKAVTEQEGLRGWWTQETEAAPEENSVAEFRFGERYHNRMRVTRLEANRRVEWKCEQGDEEWIDTRFTFDIEARGDQSVLRFTHGDWREATDFFASCNYHWGYYMRSLKQFCESGQGTPFAGE